MFEFIKAKLKKPLMQTEAKDMIFKLEYAHTARDDNGHLADMYVMYWNSQSEELVTLVIPHGRSDIAQLIQERING